MPAGPQDTIRLTGPIVQLCIILAIFWAIQAVERKSWKILEPCPCDVDATVLNQLSYQANWELVVAWVDDKKNNMPMTERLMAQALASHAE